MKSPFPGMDPFLEQPAFWSDFRARFVNYWCEAIADVLPPQYEATPVPLRDPDPDIFIDLSAVFATAYERAKFFRRIDYQAPLPALIAERDRPWVEQLVARRG